MQQAKNRDRISRTDEDLAVSHSGRNKLVAAAELVPSGRGLVAVVKLVRKVRCVVRVQHGRGGVLMRPYDAIGRAIGRHAWCSARIRKLRRGLRLRRGNKLCIRYAECLQSTGNFAIINRTIEVGGRGPYSTG